LIHPKVLPPELERRYSQHRAALRNTLHELYGDCVGFDSWFTQLCEDMASQFAARSPDLHVLDHARMAQPGWFTTERTLAYSAYVDKFAGTLRGVEAQIPYLKSLGTTYLHLLPFLRARAGPHGGENDGGFAIASFDEVQPALGTMDDLRSLTKALRREGISLCTDFILNHVADDHTWALAAKAGNGVHRDYFHVFDRLEDTEKFASHLGQIFPETAPGNFTFVKGLQAWAWTTFYPYQWDLNYSNPRVFSSIALALLHLANQGVEIFRLDSAAFLWKRAGTNCMNQPECHLILQALRSVVDIVAPGVLLKAEAIVPVNELPPYFGTGAALGRECHLAYNSSLMTASWLSLAEQDADMICRVMRSTPRLPSGCAWLTYVRCHDDIGWNVLRPELQDEPDGGDARLIRAANFFAGQTSGSYATGASFQARPDGQVHGTNGMTAALVGLSSAQSPQQVAHAFARLKLMYGLALCAGGTPLIYMGDELAQGNDRRSPTLWPPGADGRQLHRPDFSKSEAGAPSGHSAIAQSMLKHLIAVRSGLPDLAAHTATTLLASTTTRVLAFRRGERLTVVANFTEQPLSLITALPGIFEHGASFTDCIGNTPVDAGCVLTPWQIVWLIPASTLQSN
jgi:amylosucrase